jgi:hypothetical protein
MSDEKPSPAAIPLTPLPPRPKPPQPLELEEKSGGPKGAEPTRFGDWERNGRCSDF